MTGRLRRQQDIEYYTSLYNDILKPIKRDREKQRSLVAQLVATKLPTSFDDLLDEDERRLFRLRPAFLTSEERQLVQNLKEEKERLDAGGCMLTEDDDTLFKLRIPGVYTNLCFDIYNIFEQGLVNPNLELADVMIVIEDTGEEFRYPLDKAETDRLFNQAISLGININSYPSKLIFPDLVEVADQLAILKAEEEFNYN